MSKKSTPFPNKNAYRNAIKVVRKYANGFTPTDGFDIRQPYSSLSTYQKRKLRRYLNLIDSQTSRSFKVVRPRSKKRLRALQEFARQEEFPSGLKVAFVPVSDPSDTLVITYGKDGKVKYVVEGGNIRRKEILFDPYLLIDDPKAAAKEIAQKTPNSDAYILMTREFEIPGSLPGSLLEKIQRYQTNYAADKYDPDDPSSHYFGNWMTGVVSYEFDRQVEFDAFIKEKAKVKKLLNEVRSRKTSKKRKKVLLARLQKYKLKTYKK